MTWFTQRDGCRLSWDCPPPTLGVGRRLPFGDVRKMSSALRSAVSAVALTAFVGTLASPAEVEPRRGCVELSG